MENADLQSRYMAEVLGINPFPHAHAEPEKVMLSIEHEELDEPMTTLLNKILGSVHIAAWAPAGIASHHILKFNGQLGRQAMEDHVVWNLPLLSQMSGHGPEVATYKKSAWNLLQQFAREAKHQ